MKAVIDKSGRVVIPKSVRQSLGLVPGTTFDVVERANGVELHLPERPSAKLIRKGQFLVAARTEGPPVSADLVRALRDAGHR